MSSTTETGNNFIESTIILVTLRFATGGLLLITGILKFVSWPYFPLTLSTQYTMIPEYLTTPLAIAVPALETLVGLLLLLGIKPRRTALAATALFALFALTLTVQHFFVVPVEDCGCTPGVIDLPPVMILIDVLFGGFGLCLYWNQKHPYSLMG